MQRIWCNHRWSLQKSHFWVILNKEFDNQLHKIITSAHQRVTIILHIKDFNRGPRERTTKPEWRITTKSWVKYQNLLFSFVYFLIFKGLFLQLQSMSLSFHVRFILTILPLFYFLRTWTITVKFIISSLLFFCFFF